MTEKRFRMEYVDSEIYYIVDYDGKHIGDFELLDLLNKLYEENQELKEKLRKIEEITYNLKEE